MSIKVTPGSDSLARSWSLSVSEEVIDVNNDPLIFIFLLSRGLLLTDRCTLGDYTIEPGTEP